MRTTDPGAAAGTPGSPATDAPVRSADADAPALEAAGSGSPAAASGPAAAAPRRRTLRPRRGGARLRVGVPPAQLHASGPGGDARVWAGQLAALRDGHPVRLVEVARRARVDVWLVSGHAPLPEAVLADERPAVAHLHEAPWADPAQAPLLHPVFREEQDALGAAAAARATHVAAVSAHSAAEVAAHYRLAPERVHVVGEGLDHGAFRPDGPATPPAGGVPAVLFVGTAHPRKNLGALREAVAAVATTDGPLALRLVVAPPGDRPDGAALVDAALAAVPGLDVAARRAPTDAELAALMRGAAVVALPSLGEGFGRPALEGLACGAPVLAGARGALPEVVGDAGLLVEPDAAAIAEGLRRLLGDRERAARLRSAGPARARAFTWERTAAALFAILRAARERA